MYTVYAGDSALKLLEMSELVNEYDDPTTVTVLGLTVEVTSLLLVSGQNAFERYLFVISTKPTSFSKLASEKYVLVFPKKA